MPRYRKFHSQNTGWAEDVSSTFQDQWIRVAHWLTFHFYPTPEPALFLCSYLSSWTAVAGGEVRGRDLILRAQ